MVTSRHPARWILLTTEKGLATMRRQATRQRRVHDLTLIAGGLYLLLFSPVGARGEQTSPVGCPPLPERGPANAVSIYVAKALDVPGVVCARVINGFSSSIASGLNLKLQKWQEGKGSRRGEFHDFRDPGSAPFLVTANIMAMQPGVIVNQRLPYSGQPAPPGRYRVCFSYIPPGQAESQPVCSVEFQVP
jgi:hypothetical protein